MYQYQSNQPEYSVAYQQAVRQVQAKIGFYRHLASYLIVNGMLIAIYLITGIGAGDPLKYYPWFIWTMLPWGVGLAFHALKVFGFSSARSEQRMIEREMQRMGVQKPYNYDQK